MYIGVQLYNVCSCSVLSMVLRSLISVKLKHVESLFNFFQDLDSCVYRQV